MSPKVTKGYIDDKRRVILASAAEVFIRKGFSAATMQDIVDACGISRGGLYLFFSSTEEILLALLDSEGSGEEEAAMMDSGKSALELLQAFLDAQCASLLDIKNTLLPPAYEFFIKMKDREDVRALLERRRGAALATLQGMLEIGASHGEFTAQAARGLPGFVVSFLEGLILQAISVGATEKMLREQTGMLMEFDQSRLS